MSQSGRPEADGVLRVSLRASSTLRAELIERLGALAGIAVVGEAPAREADLVVAEWPARRAAAREGETVLWVIRSEEGAAPPAGQSFVPARAADVQWQAAIQAVVAGLSVRPQLPAAGARGDDEPADVEPLTPRERDVLDLLAMGLPNRTIAQRLGISEHTVKFHLAAIFGKLQATTRTEAIRRALREGLITL